MRSLFAAVLFFSVLSAPAVPQRPGETVIRTSTRLVQVSVIATDKAGKPAADLTRDDFVLTEDGKPQQIRFFSLEKGDEIAAPARRLPAGVASNRLEYNGGLPNSATVLLFDALNTPPGYFGRYRSQLNTFLHQVNPRFRIAIYTLGKSLKVLHDFTTDAALLTKSLSGVRDIVPDLAPREWDDWIDDLKSRSDLDGGSQQDVLGAAAFVIGASVMREQDMQNEQRTLSTLQAIQAVARRLSVIPGRKNLVWVSTGFPLAMALDTPLTIGRPGPFGALPVPRQRTFVDEFDRSVRALSDASVAVYPVDARGLLALAGASNITMQSENEATMRDMARRTGGKMYFGKEVHNALPEILEHARVSYTLAYYPGNSNYDGKFREIRVKTSRPGLSLKHRTGYLALPDAAQTEEQRKAELMGAVWSPVDATAIPFEASLERAASDPADQRTLAIRVDGTGLDFAPRANALACRLEMFVVQKNAEGKQVDGNFDAVEFSVPEAKLAAMRQSGYTHRKALRLNPEAQILRVVVRNTAGALGSLSMRLR